MWESNSNWPIPIFLVISAILVFGDRVLLCVIGILGLDRSSLIVSYMEVLML